MINKIAGAERHTSNDVAAVVFDYRGLDTLGEEFILFAAVMGVALLLREVRAEGARRPVDAVRSEALRLVGLGFAAPALVVGLFVVAYGYVTPGGGFQGGVAVAGALLLVYLAGEYRAYRDASPTGGVDFAEGAGVGAFVATGLAALVAGSAFLTNVLPLGKSGTLASAGTIPVVNAAAGLAVAAAFVLLFGEFLEEVEGS